MSHHHVQRTGIMARKGTVHPINCGRQGLGKSGSEGSADPTKIWSWGHKLHMTLIFVLCLNECVYDLHLSPFHLILL